MLNQYCLVGQCNLTFNIQHFSLLLHRHTTMLLGWQLLTLCSKLSQATANAETSVARLDNVVDITV